MIDATGLMVFYENMLALNNVSIKCNENQIVGIFGANSAGKSTLMYILSGIIEDIRKKEAMAGGERVSVWGKLNIWEKKSWGSNPASGLRKDLSFARNDAEFLKSARCWKICVLVAIWLPPPKLRRP